MKRPMLNRRSLLAALIAAPLLPHVEYCVIPIGGSVANVTSRCYLDGDRRLVLGDDNRFRYLSDGD